MVALAHTPKFVLAPERLVLYADETAAWEEIDIHSVSLDGSIHTGGGKPT